MNILIIGGGGQVGAELRQARWGPAVAIHAPSRRELDLTDRDGIWRLIGERPWSAVINAAAYTAVDEAETEVETAWRVNALGPALLAAQTRRADIPLIHLSTDYVFSGEKPSPYVETDAVGPLSVYGASKEAGEQAVRTGNPRHLILRTAWVIGPHGKNFLKTMLRLGSERALLRIVDDQLGSPTVAADLAGALATLTERLARGADVPYGTYHFANSGETTWFGLAKEIFRLGARFGGPQPRLEPVTSAEYPTAARRPANSRLFCERLAQSFGIVPRPWTEAIGSPIEQLLSR